MEGIWKNTPKEEEHNRIWTPQGSLSLPESLVDSEGIGEQIRCRGHLLKIYQTHSWLRGGEIETNYGGLSTLIILKG